MEPTTDSTTPITQEEVAQAEADEQREFANAQTKYLNQRIVILRVQNNRLQAEVDRLTRALSEDIHDVEEITFSE